MIRLFSYDFKDYKLVPHGNLGAGGIVYKIDETTAYKIYRDKVKDEFSGLLVSNPIFALPKRHFSLLKSRSKKLKYSSVIKDVIYINGQLGGVAITFYNGKILSELTNLPMKVKVDLSRQIIRNFNELTDNKIYPTDCKLNNIMYVDGEIKLIDLDDSKTHVCLFPSFFYKRKGIHRVKKSIYELFNEDQRLRLPISVREKIGRGIINHTGDFKPIEQFLLKKEQKSDFIFIDKKTSLETLKRLLENHEYKIVYTIIEKLDKKEYIEIIEKLNEAGISLYDFVLNNEIDKYDSIENTNESYIMFGKILKKIPKKN